MLRCVTVVWQVVMLFSGSSPGWLSHYWHLVVKVDITVDTFSDFVKPALVCILTWGVVGRGRSAMVLRSANSLANWKTTTKPESYDGWGEQDWSDNTPEERQYDFLTMALFSLMFSSRFCRLWDRTSFWSSSSSSSCCFVLHLPLGPWGGVSLTGFWIFFFWGSCLVADSLLTGNL